VKAVKASTVRRLRYLD